METGIAFSSWGLVTKLLTRIHSCHLGKARCRHNHWEGLVVEMGFTADQKGYCRKVASDSVLRQVATIRQIQQGDGGVSEQGDAA